MNNYGSKMCFNELLKDSKNISKKLQKLPLNLRKQARRELRNNNVQIAKRNKKRRKTKKLDFQRQEHDALVQASDMELRQILENNETLSDVPYDVTPEELLGEIAIAKGHATTIYVQRDGLSTLTVVLPHESPTIAQLKRAIEVYSRAQLKREQRVRYEERLQRRQNENIQKRLPIDNSNTLSAGTDAAAAVAEHNNDRQPVPANTNINNNKCMSKSGKGNSNSKSILEALLSTGELVCSVARNGHAHRANVSWRYLWRAYALYNVDTKQPINDENGRKLLSELGIENAATLKFNQREKYFGRKRQK